MSSNCQYETIHLVVTYPAGVGKVWAKGEGITLHSRVGKLESRDSTGGNPYLGMESLPAKLIRRKDDLVTLPKGWRCTGIDVKLASPSNGRIVIHNLIHNRVGLNLGKPIVVHLDSYMRNVYVSIKIHFEKSNTTSINGILIDSNTLKDSLSELMD